MMKMLKIIVIVLVTGFQMQAVWSADRIELDDTSIVGTRELPKVLYIVPWKNTRLGTLAGVSENGSFDEGLVALDREVLQKEIEYYDILYRSEEIAVK
jgi:hypothetical protein